MSLVSSVIYGASDVTNKSLARSSSDSLRTGGGSARARTAAGAELCPLRVVCIHPLWSWSCHVNGEKILDRKMPRDWRQPTFWFCLLSSVVLRQWLSRSPIQLVTEQGPVLGACRMTDGLDSENV